MQLTPTVEDVAGLLVRMSREPWPTTETERLDYFDRLGLHDVGEPEVDRDHADSSRASFSTSLPGEVEGSFTLFRDQLLGLSLFCYSERVVDGARARKGFAGIKHHLSNELGLPIEEWGPVNEPACMWKTGSLLLDMYCFQRGSSSVMVGALDLELSAASEAAHAR